MLATFATLAAPASATTRRVTVSNCGRLVVRPTSVVLACADANYGLTGLRWSSWGGSTARATGSVRANDCTPYCAAGHFHSYRARVVLDRRTSCGTVLVYLRLAIHYPSTRPKGYGAVDVHTWTCREATTR